MPWTSSAFRRSFTSTWPQSPMQSPLEECWEMLQIICRSLQKSWQEHTQTIALWLPPLLSPCPTMLSESCTGTFGGHRRAGHSGSSHLVLATSCHQFNYQLVEQWYTANTQPIRASSCALGRTGEFPGHCYCWSFFLPVCWPASHHPEQHRTCPRLWTASFLLQQVSPGFVLINVCSNLPELLLLKLYQIEWGPCKRGLKLCVPASHHNVLYSIQIKHFTLMGWVHSSFGFHFQQWTSQSIFLAQISK